MHHFLLGVTEPTPTRAYIRVAPDDGGSRGAPGLPYVRGQTFTSRGLVTVDWSPALGTLVVVLPDATTTDIVNPVSCSGSLRVLSLPPGGSVVSQSADQVKIIFYLTLQ
jgi:hypothetical protein